MSSKTKGLVLSTTIQGAIVAGVPAIDQALVLLGIFDEPLLTQAAAAIASAAGSLLAIWGRIKAKKTLFGLF